MAYLPASSTRPAIPGAGSRGRVFTREELVPVVLAHRNFLQRKPGGKRAQLAGATLCDLNLSRALLTEADFTGANLSRSRLVGTQLERACFFTAALFDCDLSNANLKSADLRGASLRGANLAFANLDGADMREALMFRVGEGGQFERNIAASEETLGGGVDFSNCSMKGTSFNAVNLRGANFRDALLEQVSFKHARVTGVCLDGAVISQPASELPFSREEMKNCLLDPSREALARAHELFDRIKAHEAWVVTGARDGSAGKLDDEDLRPLAKAFAGRALTALSARASIAVGVNFTRCQLQGANFDNADLRDASFAGADLRGASFRDAKLAHARFEGADIGPLPLRQGQVKAVDFAGAQYAETQFARATGFDTAMRGAPEARADGIS